MYDALVSISVSSCKYANAISLLTTVQRFLEKKLKKKNIIILNTKTVAFPFLTHKSMIPLQYSSFLLPVPYPNHLQK